MKNNYYIALNDPGAGLVILGSGWSEQAARADAAENGADNIHSLLRIPVELAERIEREGDSPALAALCYAQGKNTNQK
jgi:hypothetical protein